MRRLVSTACVILAASACAPARPGAAPRALPSGFPAACAPDEVQVMLLGTYHMANPGLDAITQDIDDVLAPRRQAELEALAEGLARWRPQQVAVEAEPGDSARWRAAFERYRAGTLPPDRSEIVQVGFRVASRLGLPGVDPFDHEMRIGNDSVGPLLERRADLREHAAAVHARLQAHTDSSNAWLRRVTLSEYLRFVNSDEELRMGNSYGMFGSLMPVGEGGNYGGPQVIARWYERNGRMVHHLHRALRPGTERVLVIVGSGHVPPLRALLDEDPKFCPVSPLGWLP